MIFYRYNLKDYYEKTYYNLILFDALFKKEDKNKEVTFVIDEGNHFEFFRERLEKALEYFA